MFKVIETFSGIGAQAKALSRIGIPYEIVHTCEWDINAMIAYCQIHKQINLKKYENVSDEEIVEYLKAYTLSSDGKAPLNEKTFKALTAEIKRLIYISIHETNNLVSITDVKGEIIPTDIDLLTYSFPCQDLSMCGYWHGNKSGISRDANNRSGMLWEVERILKEMHELGKTLPQFLLMENVTNILSQTHKRDFDDWKSTLNSLGYQNHIYRLNAKNFGVPQKRERAYMISILTNNDLEKYIKVERYFEDNNLENPSIAKRFASRMFRVQDILRLDYSINKYKNEANESQPNYTESRKKIEEDNDMLFDGSNVSNIDVNTVTTKQDRNPNSGLITYNSHRDGKAPWRYLLPRECFMLMGFDEEDYDRAVSINPDYCRGRKLLTNEKMIKMAGNSICVDVLEAVFKQIYAIRELLK